MSRLPFTISNQSLTFFVKGRPFSLTRDHEHYAAARAHLVQTEVDHDVDMLKDWVDTRGALLRMSHGRIVFDGNSILFAGKPLHNVWVDKIFEMRSQDEDFSPFWNALDRLVHNPTLAAIERLPIFLERTKLGFLPDGRFIAFKGVRSDLRSCHQNLDGTYFTHAIGDKPRMERHEVDANPNQTCSTGLHVGAPGYVRQFYNNGQVVLVAVDPVDVVSVPTDYDGEKMRVCGYEVIDHLDRDFSDELLGRLTTATAYSGSTWAPAAPAPEAFDITSVNVGDVVSYAGSTADQVPAGDYVVTDLDRDPEGDDGRYLYVATSTGETWLLNTLVTGIVSRAEPEDDDEEEGDWTSGIEVGDVVKMTDDTYAFVLEVHSDHLGIRDVEGDLSDLLEGQYDGTVLPHEEVASLFACIGAVVRIEGDEMLRDGDYTIEGLTHDGNGQEDEADTFFTVGNNEIPIANGSIKTVTYRGEQRWPRTKIEVSGDTVTQAEPDGAACSLETAALRAQVGDLVEIVQGGWPPAGVYPVIRVDEGAEYRLTVRTEHDGEQGVLNTYVASLTPRPWMRAEIGGYVTLGEAFPNSLDNWPAAGRYEVMDLALSNEMPQLQLRTISCGGWWVAAHRVTAVEPKA